MCRRTAYGDRGPAYGDRWPRCLLDRRTKSTARSTHTPVPAAENEKQAVTLSSLQEPREVCVTDSEAERTQACMEQEMRVVRASRTVTYQRALSKPRGQQTAPAAGVESMMIVQKRAFDLPADGPHTGGRLARRIRRQSITRPRERCSDTRHSPPRKCSCRKVFTVAERQRCARAQGAAHDCNV